MILSKLKLYGAAVVAGLLFVLSAAVKILTAKNKRLKKEVTAATEHAERAVEVITHDRDVDIQVDEHLAEVVHGDDDELTNSNDWN